MSTIEPLGPPELPESAETEKTPKLQLIASTKPAAPAAELDEPDELNEHVDEPGDPDGVLAAEAEREWQESQADRLPETAYRPRRRWPLAILILILIAVAAVGAYTFGSFKGTPPTPKAATTTPKKISTTATTSTVTPTKHYDSATYTLGFDYPQTWTVADTTAKLVVASPNLSLSTIGGSNTEGHVVVTIQNQQTTVAGFPAGGALAVLASDKLTYKQPTQVQRAQTYLSYLSYGKTNGLDALYITGDTGYQLGQQVPMSDIVKGNPLISVTFQNCTNADCSTGTPTMLTVLADKWKDASVAKDVTTLLQSITLN